MAEKSYKMGDLRRLIKESANDFKPKMGNGVETGNKTNNEKSYKDSKKRIKDFDGGGNEYKPTTKAPDKIDGNKTTLDYAPENASPEYKKRVKAQAEGYTSTLEKDNKIEKDPSAEFSDKIYNQFADAGEELAKNIEATKKEGLTGRETAKNNPNAFKKDSMYENKIAVLNFKKTTFLNEDHMISRIPDEYKVEGNRFKMKDNSGNEFIVEWKEDEANILHYENKKRLNESLNRIQHLFNYSYSDQNKNSTSQTRLNEEKDFNEILSTVRQLSDK